MPKYNLKLIEKYEAAGGTPAYQFAKPEGFDYLSGQHLVVNLDFKTDNPDEQIRDMTLASSPTEEYLEIVMRQSESPFKRHLAGLELGAEISVFGPTGIFVLPKDTMAPVVMIAGGIGITPFRSMIRYIIDKNLPYKILLLYSNPNEVNIAFKKEFDDIQADAASGIEIKYSLTQEAAVGWPGERGRIDSEMIKKYAIHINDSVFMVCGPENMVHYINSILLDMGVAQEKVLREEFTGYEEKLV